VNRIVSNGSLEASGVEPESKNTSKKGSTRVVSCLYSITQHELTRFTLSILLNFAYQAEDTQAKLVSLIVPTSIHPRD